MRRCERSLKAKGKSGVFSSLVIGDRVTIDAASLLIWHGGSVAIGNDVMIGEGVVIECDVAGTFTLGEGSILRRYIVASARKHVSVGANTLIGEFSSIRDHDHDFSRRDTTINAQGFAEESICVGDDVWIGRGVAILKGVTVGAHTVVGANSVVTTNIPEWSVAVGAPARVIKKR